jgi:hypothetical protein
MTPTQSYANHTRWHPAYHFIVLPVLLINFLWSVVAFFMAPNVTTGLWILVSLALLILAAFVRTYSLKVQDRVIRLEERLRYQQLLPPALAEQCRTLTAAQIVALRFAGDDELEELVSATLAGKFAGTKDIKQAVKNWRADMFRV